MAHERLIICNTSLLSALMKKDTLTISKSAYIARALQSGCLGGLVAIPVMCQFLHYRAHDIFLAALVLAVLAMAASVIVSYTYSPNRGLWGFVFSIILLIINLGNPVQ